jgi:HlyD family secretion protein
MTKKKKEKKSRKWLIWVLLAIMAIMMVLLYFRAQSKPKGEEVTIEQVKKRTIKETVTASGKVFPEKEIKISSDVSGEIVKLLVEEGDSVVVGQILAKIDPEAYLSQVERAEAGLNSTRSQISISESQIQSSIAQKEQIVAQLENAKTINKRNKQLREEGVISQAEYEQSEATLRGLEANIRASEASIESARQNKESAAFSVKSAEASLKEFKTSLNRTTIKAPASGIVSSLSVEQGERVVGTIQMTGTEMMRVANLNAMEVQVDVSENDILKVEVGDMVDIEVDAYLEKKFKGTVTEIANSASNIGTTAALNSDQVTNFIVKIRIDPASYNTMGTKYPFRPGMSASVDIFTESMEGVLSIPIQAVTTREQEDENGDATEEFDEVVFVKSADTVRMVKIVTGIQDDEFIIVKSGLELEEEIVSGPYSAISKRLDEGDNIRIKEEKDEDDKDGDK